MTRSHVVHVFICVVLTQKKECLCVSVRVFVCVCVCARVCVCKCARAYVRVCECVLALKCARLHNSEKIEKERDQ